MSDNTEKRERERERDFDSIEKTIERRFESDSALCVCVCGVHGDDTCVIRGCEEVLVECVYNTDNYKVLL